jgi:hypothetical protein
MNLAAMCQFAAEDQAQQSAAERQYTLSLHKSGTDWRYAGWSSASR